MTTYRVHVHSAPGQWEFYEGYVDVQCESTERAFEEAVKKLSRTAFPDRASLSSWRLDHVAPVG